MTVAEYSIHRGKFAVRGGSNRAGFIADRIIALVEGAEPGARLGSKQELRERCGGSVGSFNEALRIVQSQGLIVARPGPGGGLFVAERVTSSGGSARRSRMSGMETPVAEALRIRGVVEPLILEDAIWHASLADIATMRRTLDRAADAARRGDALEFIESERQLHVELAAYTPHAMLRTIYETVVNAIAHNGEAVLLLRNDVADELQRRLETQEALVHALSRRDSRAAAEALRHRHGDQGR
jgi:DNA-binding FadR family transcriptional regulator